MLNREIESKIREHDASLEQNKKFATITQSNFYAEQKTVQKAKMVIIDDDGSYEVINKLKPISIEKNVPMCVAIPHRVTVDKFMSQGDLLELQNLGWEITAHGYDHQHLINYTGKDLDFQLSENKKWLQSLGITVNNIVYPYGESNEEVRKLASKYYNCGVQVGDGINTIPVDNFHLNRVALGSFFDDTNVNNTGTLTYYKSKLDEAISKNGLIIYMTHCWHIDHNETQQQNIRDLIDYAKAQNVEIITLQQAYEIFGNSIEVVNNKDSTYKEFKITKQGKVFSTGNMWMDDVKRNNTMSIKEYKKGVVTVTICKASENTGFIDGGIGILYTYRLDKEWEGWNYQMFYPLYSEKIWRRKWDNSNNKWFEWINLNAQPTLPVKIEGQNSHTNTSPVTEFTNGIITVFNVNIAGGNGFPNNNAGIVMTYRIQGNGWDRQEFFEYNTNNEYVRYVNLDGTWGVWKNKKSGYDIQKDNIRAESDNISLYDNGITTFSAIGWSLGNGYVTTYKSKGNGWDKQEFRKTLSNEIWGRYVDISGNWTAFSKMC